MTIINIFWIEVCVSHTGVGAKQAKEELVMAVETTLGSTSLAEVVDRILDKGLVIEAWVRVSLAGIELLAIEARIVIAGVDTYLKYAEAVGLITAAQEARS